MCVFFLSITIRLAVTSILVIKSCLQRNSEMASKTEYEIDSQIAEGMEGLLAGKWNEIKI